MWHTFWPARRRKSCNRGPARCRPCLEVLEDRRCPSSFGFGWAAQAGSPTFSDGGTAVATDSAGNAYVVGDFSGKASFGTGAGATTLTSAGNQDAFVAKYSPTGSLLWAKDLGGAGGYDYGRGIAVDGSGNVFVTGDFSGTSVFGAGEPGQTTLSSLPANGGESIFVARLNATSGDLVWAEQFGGTVDNVGRGIAVDTTGNVYLTGGFMGNVAFGTTTLSSIYALGATNNNGAPPLVQDGDTFTVNDGTHSVTFEMDDNGSVAPGNVAVSFTTGESGNQIDRAIAQAINNANAVGLTAATAAYRDSVYIAHAVSVTTVPVNPTNPGLAVGQSWSPFVAQLQESTGSVSWATKVEDGNPDEQLASAVAVSGSAVYLAGQEQHAPNGLDPTSFIAKLTTAGSGPQWLDKVASAQVTAIAADGSGNVLSTGNFKGKVNFNPGGSFTLSSHKAGSSYNFDAFVWKLDSNGKFAWADDIGGNGTRTNTGGQGIAVDSAGSVYITGWFNNTVNFNPGKGSYTLTATGGSNAFVVKLASAGQFGWAVDLVAGATGGGGFAIALDSAGDVYTTGWFSGTGDFDPTSGTDLLTSIGTEDMFLSKLTQP